MRVPTLSERLDLWEQGQHLSCAQRISKILAVTYPDQAIAPEQLSVGRSDALLMTAHTQLFGSQLDAVADCPSCHSPLELSLSLTDLQITDTDPVSHPLYLQHGDYVFELRLPTHADLDAIASFVRLEQSRWALLERCVIAAHRNGEVVAVKDLPESVDAAITEYLAAADPQANVRLVLDCAACSHRWEAPFDALRFFWNALGFWVMGTLHEVHVLAQAYGWSEADIFALSAWRRRHYLEKII